MDTPPTGGPPTPYQPVAWATDPELTGRLRRATQTILDSLSTVIDAGEPFSTALHGGAEHVCDAAELDYSWAPMVEAEAVRAVTNAFGNPDQALFISGLSRIVQHIDALPLDEQQRLVQRAADRYTGGPVWLLPRSTAARAVSPALGAAPPRRESRPDVVPDRSNVLPFNPRTPNPPRMPGR
ncbi:hypothetical protein I3J09_16250 [Streptomyces clavuligerus]|uniref:Uncharacterized protein n=1 Tax=Streptomyces clavuligerus TaxID=1901 RepID=B5GPJ1_STRCL|nr:hypothetical protein BB341_16030 [Streptomyces clavuligerus]AXU14227.1 hypothetical protein D1794_16720 [Streptomyces clavuligerus]EDY48237.1 hypothetical protein SSCG_01518 [Streptomyces clavuligerus]EFG07559.1 Hypothetical protein SCLAV_2486 [Streptomyces clavuligerus]MBY6304228.1 hypothetical protein [Streptomyces clavuligerus]